MSIYELPIDSPSCHVCGAKMLPVNYKCSSCGARTDPTPAGESGPAEPRVFQQTNCPKCRHRFTVEVLGVENAAALRSEVERLTEELGNLGVYKEGEIWRNKRAELGEQEVTRLEASWNAALKSEHETLHKNRELEAEVTRLTQERDELEMIYGYGTGEKRLTAGALQGVFDLLFRLAKIERDLAGVSQRKKQGNKAEDVPLCAGCDHFVHLAGQCPHCHCLAETARGSL